jgi:hypothetical protein
LSGSSARSSPFYAPSSTPACNGPSCRAPLGDARMLILTAAMIKATVGWKRAAARRLVQGQAAALVADTNSRNEQAT